MCNVEKKQVKPGEGLMVSTGLGDVAGLQSMWLICTGPEFYLPAVGRKCISGGRFRGTMQERQEVILANQPQPDPHTAPRVNRWDGSVGVSP